MSITERTKGLDRSREILSICPTLVQGRVGWLAVSPPGSVLRIGVVGQTKSAACQRFADEAAAWAALAELPDMRPGP